MFKTDLKDKTLKTKFNSRKIQHRSKTHKSHKPNPKEIKSNAPPTQTIPTHPNPIMVKTIQDVSNWSLNQIRSHASSIVDANSEACFVLRLVTLCIELQALLLHTIRNITLSKQYWELGWYVPYHPPSKVTSLNWRTTAASTNNSKQKQRLGEQQTRGNNETQDPNTIETDTGNAKKGTDTGYQVTILLS